ncbi:helix-turn-helix domain containing protein [Shewanella subflava]|uniref:Helix-turn-helix domain containing protein n=1 Tax=Shewanella subflava TaxID=2986476 RepID=A0ABT3I5Z4_9GAMM|nr:helix-turn-helix domain containing protein [Shewanella subflava]MCW3171248.1 helix-turn-helix domain containing protein [Shewanella subflava]
MSGYVKYKHDKLFKNLNKPLSCDGGKVLIERLINLFEVRNRVELSDLIGVTPATLSTWTTRGTTSHELLIRIHLLTGWPLEYLCFGIGDLSKIKGKTSAHFSEQVNEVSEPKLAYNRGVLQVYTIDNGHLAPYEKIEATSNLINHFLPKSHKDGVVLKQRDNLLFIDTTQTEANQGNYLFKVNENHQLGELKLLPDGHVYLLEGNERFQIDPTFTKVVGKVVSVLKKT